jgi:hypothetical protein
MRMKIRKNLLLSAQAVRCGSRLAARRGTSLSEVVERELLSASTEQEEPDYWPRPTKPVRRAGDRRFDYLRRKHA